MATRKFNGARAYKVVKTVVLVIASALVAFGGIRLMRYNNIESMYLQLSDKYCGRLEDYYLDLCYQFLQAPDGYFQNSVYTLSSGIGLLVLFFGGTWMLKYLFPHQRA